MYISNIIIEVGYIGKKNNLLTTFSMINLYVQMCGTTRHFTIFVFIIKHNTFLVNCMVPKLSV